MYNILILLLFFFIMKGKTISRAISKTVQEAALELKNKRASDRLARIKIDIVFMRCREYLPARSLSAVGRNVAAFREERIAKGDRRRKWEEFLPKIAAI